MRDAFKTLCEIDDKLGLRKVSDAEWSGVVATGDFRGQFDYGRGLLVLSVFKSGSPAAFSGVCVSSIDDGVWQAQKSDITEEQVEAVAKKFIEEFGMRLPSEEDLNLFLRPFGMYGLQTG